MRMYVRTLPDFLLQQLCLGTKPHKVTNLFQHVYNAYKSLVNHVAK